jgi:hypothetical protein
MILFANIFSFFSLFDSGGILGFQDFKETEEAKG